jgi:hypothetical protein
MLGTPRERTVAQQIDYATLVRQAGEVDYAALIRQAREARSQYLRRLAGSVVRQIKRWAICLFRTSAGYNRSRPVVRESQ